MSGPSVEVVNAPGIAAAVQSCWSTALVRDRHGKEGRGFLNLKRLLGRPAQFRIVVEALGRTVPEDVAVAACDQGAWPLVGALVLELGVAGVLVRPEPKPYFVSYGDDPALGDPRLAGERLEPGGSVHLIDDLLHSGETLRRAASVLTGVGLTVRTASVIVATDLPASTAGLPLEVVTCLVDAAELELPSANTGRTR